MIPRAKLIQDDHHVCRCKNKNDYGGRRHRDIATESAAAIVITPTIDSGGSGSHRFSTLHGLL